MNTTMQQILDNQQQFEKKAIQLNQLKLTYGSLIEGFKILNTYEPLDKYDRKLSIKFQELIELDINRDLKKIKERINLLDENKLQKWFAALEKKQKCFTANSKVQKIIYNITVAITCVAISLAVLSCVYLGLALGLYAYVAGLIGAALIDVIAVRSFEKRFKENNRAASEISKSKNDLDYFFISQKANSQNKNDKTSEGFDLPITHNKQSKDAMLSNIEKDLNSETVNSLDALFNRYQIESKKSAFAQHRYPFWDNCVGNNLTRTHAKLIDIFSKKLATLIKDTNYFSEEEVEKLNGHGLWKDLATFNPELFEILTKQLREKCFVTATPYNDSVFTNDVVFCE